MATLLTRAATTPLATSTQRRSFPTSSQQVGSRSAFQGADVFASPARSSHPGRVAGSIQCAAAPSKMDTNLEAGLVWPKWQPAPLKINTWFKDFPEGPAANAVLGLLRGRGLEVYDEARIQKLLPKLEKYWEHFSKSSIDYPDYYLEPFHVWHGNLNWPAAANSEAVMAFFNFNNLSKEDRALLPDLADVIGPNGKPVTGKNVDASRSQSIRRAAAAIVDQLGKPAEEVRNVVDLGCGAGRPTRLLAHHFPNAKVVGIDASPHFLSWAVFRATPEMRAKELLAEEVVDSRVTFKRALAEATGLPNASQDVVMIPYVAHETPVEAREAILREAKRILRPNGVVAFVDHRQAGSIGNLIFMKLKPLSILGDVWHAINNFGAPELELREYHSKYLEDSLRDTGFLPGNPVPVTTAQNYVGGRRPA